MKKRHQQQEDPIPTLTLEEWAKQRGYDPEKREYEEEKD